MPLEHRLSDRDGWVGQRNGTMDDDGAAVSGTSASGSRIMLWSRRVKSTVQSDCVNEITGSKQSAFWFEMSQFWALP